MKRGLYTKKILSRIYAQKAAPGLDKGKNRRLKKKFYFAFAAKNGGLYTKGVIHQALQCIVHPNDDMMIPITLRDSINPDGWVHRGVAMHSSLLKLLGETARRQVFNSPVS